ncbi:MAG: ATP-dependent zinc metalloprotease FtsH [Parcubacteria group bacterium GW2011_GWA2_39_18]|nr:MAG: ATP-dependent zinc metalloprotease FtsH [Parcubacteria group bacterium GW2011_GWA2_39_18]
MKPLAGWIIVFVVLGAILYWFSHNSKKSLHLDYSQFIEMVENGKIAEVNFKNGNAVVGKTTDGQKFNVYLPAPVLNDSQLTNKLIAKNVKISTKSLDSGRFLNLLLFLIVPILMIVFLIFFFKNISKQQMQQINKIDGHTKSSIRLSVSEKTTFKDVVGIDEAKAELEEMVAFLKSPKKFTKLGARIPRGVLLAGPPGCGKTLLARAVAGESGASFFFMSGSEFVEVFVGVGASRVRDTFSQAKAKSPAIIFIDELDAIGGQRGASIIRHEEREQTLNQILAEMDGFSTDIGIIVIAATNRPDILDPALLRSGRFDRHVFVPKPDLVGRREILKVHTRNIPLDEKIDLGKIAQITPGFSGADLASLANEAAIYAAKEDASVVSTRHFELARDKMIMGPARKMLIDDEEKKSIAYHEAGHTLVAKLIPGADPVERVSIIPRGMMLGVTMQMPEKDKYIKSKSYFMTQLAILLGGRVAEEIMLGLENVSSGASNDLERVTSLAGQMICEWGMGSDINFRTFGETQDVSLSGLGMPKNRGVSEKTAEAVDGEINKLIRMAYGKARGILNGNSDKLSNLAKELIEKETLSAEEIDSAISGQ